PRGRISSSLGRPTAGGLTARRRPCLVREGLQKATGRTNRQDRYNSQGRPPGWPKTVQVGYRNKLDPRGGRRLRPAACLAAPRPPPPGGPPRRPVPPDPRKGETEKRTRLGMLGAPAALWAGAPPGAGAKVPAVPAAPAVPVAAPAVPGAAPAVPGAVPAAP